jgi:hypothetical protein
MDYQDEEALSPVKFSADPLYEIFRLTVASVFSATSTLFLNILSILSCMEFSPHVSSLAVRFFIPPPLFSRIRSRLALNSLCLSFCSADQVITELCFSSCSSFSNTCSAAHRSVVLAGPGQHLSMFHKVLT